MKKLKFSNKFKIIFSVLVIGIILPIFIVCAFYRPTTLNKYIVNKLYNEPVNNYFTDQNFYNCVIDAYNDENSTSHDYTYNLSDEELSSIKWLNCDGYKKSNDEKITDMTGLEKLTGLIYLNTGANLIKGLDISKNTTLTILDVSDNELTELDVSKNTLLGSLIAYNNKLSKLNISQNIVLESLNIHTNQLTELDVSNNATLELLYIYNNKLTELDVSKNTVLKWLDVNENQLTELDVGNNTNLINLNVSDNNLTSLNLSNNSLLQEALIDINMAKFLYKGTTEALEIPINFWNGIVATYKQSAPVNENIVIENNSINAKKTGKYNLILSYETAISENISGVTLIPNITMDINSTFNVIELKSDKYIIDEENNKIYYGDTFSKDNIKIMLGDEECTNDNLSLEYTNNKLIVRYNDKEIKIFNVDKLSIKSDNYIIDEENSIIYYNDSFSKDNIKVMLGDEEYTDELLSLDYSDNKLTIKYDDSVIKTFDVKTIKLTSSIYLNIDNGYIYLGSDDIDLSKITSNIGVLNINTTLNNLEVKYNDKVYKTIPIIKTNLSNYVIKGDDIYAFNEDLDINKISSTNASFEIDNDLLKLVYNDTILKTYNIKKVTISSDKYLIKDSNIYVNGTFDITKISVTNATLNVNGNKLELLINNEVIKEYDIVEFTVTSDVYEIVDKYIYSYNLEANPNYIIASIGEVVIDNDTVKIMYNDTTIDTYKLIYVNSDEYKIGSDYVFTGTSTFSLNKINSNGTLNMNNNKLELKENDKVLKTFDITSINFGDLNVNNKVITISKEMSYSDFTKNITPIGVTYKIEKDVTTSIDDPKYEEITSGNITGGLLLRVYKDDEIIAYYSINEGYYKIIDTSVKVDQTKAYISNIKDMLTVEQIKQIVETSGTISILDKNNNVKENTDLVGTGDKIKIDLGNNRIFTYTLIVKGDANGDGSVNAADAFKIIRHSIGVELLEDVYSLAGDVNSDDYPNAADAFKIVRYSIGIDASL